MKLAVMQPYFCPYLGYFQLMNSVDRFILYDDVVYIKQGWINRNRILVNGSALLITIPIEDRSSNRLICETRIIQNEAWKIKLLRTIEYAYRKAAQFDSVFPLIQKMLSSKERRLSCFIADSLLAIAEHLGVPTRIITSSTGYANSHLRGQDRILDICIKENATDYHNAIGGVDLYDRETFAERGIALRFVSPRLPEYKQFGESFIQGLSVIDVLMFNPVEKICKMLLDFELQ